MTNIRDRQSPVLNHITQSDLWRMIHNDESILK
jgi:hypothetical protein